MKKFFTLIAAVAMAASVNAQTLSFDKVIAKGSLPTSFSVDGLVLTVVDTDGKQEVDANSQYFGTKESYKKFDYRLKTGGKSLTKNNLTLTVPADGTLKVYARSGSSSAINRNVILTQDNVELFNQVVKDEDAVTVSMTGSDGTAKDIKVFPVISVAVKKGDVAITYPVNSVGFYGFELVTGTSGISNINASEAANEGATFNLLGQKVASNAKGLVIKNGKKFINK